MAKEYRVAVASRSSEVVDQHFGKCSQFLIFKLLEDRVELLEKRDNVPACNTKDKREGTLLNTCNVISDCNFVIVKKIGYEAKELLEERNITVYESFDFIEEIVENLRIFLKNSRRF